MSVIYRLELLLDGAVSLTRAHFHASRMITDHSESFVLKYTLRHFSVFPWQWRVFLQAKHWASWRKLNWKKQNKHLTIIGQRWTKSRDLPVESRSVIRLRQILDLWDTEPSRYFAKKPSAGNNCFIIRSLCLFSHLNHSLTAQLRVSDLPFFTPSVATITD